MMIESGASGGFLAGGGRIDVGLLADSSARVAIVGGVSGYPAKVLPLAREEGLSEICWGERRGRRDGEEDED